MYSFVNVTTNMWRQGFKQRQQVLLLNVFVWMLYFSVTSAASGGLAEQNTHHDALWRSQCTSIQEIYVVKTGDTPKQLMEATYAGVPWDVMWALVALCNSRAAAEINPGPEGIAVLPDGLVLSLPVFQLPGITAAAVQAAAAAAAVALQGTAMQQQQWQRPHAAVVADGQISSHLDYLQLPSATGSGVGARFDRTSSSSGGAGNGDSGNTIRTAWAPAAVCGCSERIHITQLSSWLQVAQTAYPNTQQLQLAALLLSLCNPGAAFAAHMLLQPHQQLESICPAALAHAAAALNQISINGSLSTVPPVGSAAAEVNTAAAAAVRAGRHAAFPQQQSLEEEPVCSVATITGQGTYLRQLDVQPAAACPWYADGCSGPTEGLQYQDVLTPCCNAHDYCYLCSYRLGWAGIEGRQACDRLMLSNMLQACQSSFPIAGWWDWKAKWHKFWCDSTANVMFAAVWAYQELKGGSVHTHLQCPGEYGAKLGAADFCFYR